MTPYIATGDLAKFLGVESSTLTTNLADLAVNAAMQRVRKYLAQEITYHTNRLDYLDGNGRHKIRLRERPVRKVSKVEEGNVPGTPPSWTEVSADAYLLRDDILIRWDGSVWCSGEGNLRVTYDSGWNVGQIDSDTSDSDYDVGVNNIPADIILVTLSLTRRMYEAMGAQAVNTGVEASETIGAYSYTLSDAAKAAAGVQLLDIEKAVLDGYRRTGAG